MRQDCPNPQARALASAGLPTRGPAAALLCFGGGGGGTSATTSSSTSNAISEQFGVSDEGIGVKAGGNVAVDKSVNVTDLSADTIAGAFNALQRMSEENATIARTAIEQFAGTSASVLQATSGMSAETLGTVADLGKTTATGGASDTNKTLLYVALAGVALVGILAFRK